MEQQLYDRIETILIETFKVPEDDIRPDATFESLELDSLDLVELMMVIEEELGVRIEDDEAEEIRTVADAVDKLAEKQEVGA